MSRYRFRASPVFAAMLATLCGSMPAIAAPLQNGATPVPASTGTALATTQAGLQPQVTAQAAAQAMAQAGPQPQSTAPLPAGAQAQTSTEQGQTPMDESFGPLSHDEWVRQTRRKAWEDTKFDVQLRSYYLTRDKYDDTESEAWALGGSVGFMTGYFRERFAFGATGYTSQRLHGPDDKDGTLLLKPGQHGYTVLGEVFGEFLVTDAMRLSIGRRAIDTPYINRNDSRMTPNTFESITLLGLLGGDDGGSQWRFGAGYFDEIKERNSDEFVSMSEDAGAPDGVERGVYAAGVNYKLGDFSIGAIDYYSDDIINIFYTEAKYAMPLSEDMRLQFAAQYSDQQATGDNLLRGEDFKSDQWGIKGELGYRGALFTAAYTSASGNTNMQNPWSSYPGYTSVQVEDFNRDGEDAWMLRASYAFESVKGLSLYGLYVDGSDPEDPLQYAKNEYNLNLQWLPAEGILKGLMMRLRYAHVEQDDPAGTELDDLRIMVYYDPPSL